MKPIPFLAACAVLALAGCAGMDVSGEKKPTFAPVNFRGDARLAPSIQRVVVLPLHGGSVLESESADALDPVLLAALQHQLRFEVVTLSRAECRRLFGQGSFASTDELPRGMLESLETKFAADAALFVDVTTYQPYRPISVGFRAKLATTKEVRLVWAFDDVFSASRPEMLESVRDYYRQEARSAPVDPVPAAMQSPARFTAVAAELMFRTLPAR